MALTLLQMRALFQDPMRQGIVDLLWQSSRVMQLLNFIEYTGLAYPYVQRKALPGIAFRNLNAQFVPTASVVNPAVETLAILGGKIRTDSIAVALKGERARTAEIAGAIEAAGKNFDKNFFNGDPQVTPGAFTGLKARIGAGNRLFTPTTDGTTPATTGTPLIFPDVVKLLDSVEGDNSQKTLFMNRASRRNLSYDVVLNSRGSQIMNQGQQLEEFQGAKIFEVFYDENEAPILDFNETFGASALCSSVYCVRFGDGTDERYVQGITGLPEKIQSSGPYQFGEYMDDVIQMVVGIGVFSGYGVARLQGIINEPNVVARDAADSEPSAPGSDTGVL